MNRSFTKAILIITILLISTTEKSQAWRTMSVKKIQAEDMIIISLKKILI